MQRIFPGEYDFFPRSWVLPAELNSFKSEISQRKRAVPGNCTKSCDSSKGNGRSSPSVFIVKPVASCQGKGIFLTTGFENIPEHEHCVVQEYLDEPLLLDGYKFDLRVYALVTS